MASTWIGEHNEGKGRSRKLSLIDRQRSPGKYAEKYILTVITNIESEIIPIPYSTFRFQIRRSTEQSVRNWKSLKVYLTWPMTWCVIPPRRSLDLAPGQPWPLTLGSSVVTAQKYLRLAGSSGLCSSVLKRSVGSLPTSTCWRRSPASCVARPIPSTSSTSLKSEPMGSQHLFFIFKNHLWNKINLLSH